jgi:hypothetical protein
MKITDKMVNEALKFKYGNDVVPSKTMYEKMYNLLNVALNSDNANREPSNDMIAEVNKAMAYLDEFDILNKCSLSERVLLVCTSYHSERSTTISRNHQIVEAANHLDKIFFNRGSPLAERVKLLVDAYQKEKTKWVKYDKNDPSTHPPLHYDPFREYIVAVSTKASTKRVQHDYFSADGWNHYGDNVEYWTFIPSFPNS